MGLLTHPNIILRTLLIGLPLTISSIHVQPAGIFTTNCHERHFWLSVKGSFLGSKMQFFIEDNTGVHFLSSQRAAECGYTVILNQHKDLVFRASYLACYVENRGDTDFRVRVRLVNTQTDGSVDAYPLMLHCSLDRPWSMREIVCEQNYMEVSVKWQIPVVSRKDVKWIDLQSPTMEERAKQLRAGQVIFYRPDDFDKIPRLIEDVKALGYHIVATDTRILLRNAYSSHLSYTIKEKNVSVEAVSAVIILQHDGTSIPVEISAACAKTEAVLDGLYLLWSFPLALSPLVRGCFRKGAMRLGVDDRMLSDCEMRDRGYNVSLEDQTINIRIPFGKEGAKLKSHVHKGQYAQFLSVEIFYMYHWDDAIWPQTQHRSFLLLHTPYAPQMPVVLNNTDPATKMFSVILGVFPDDVSLQSITLGGDTMTWIEAYHHHNVHLNQMLFSNGSHAYELQVPFSHPMVTQRAINGHYRRHSLALIFHLVIFPEKEHFSIRTIVTSDQKELAIPYVLRASCTENGIMIVLHYGLEYAEWELYVGDRRLDWELVQLGGYRLDGGDDHFSVEIPLYSPGIIYEDLNLKSVTVRVEASAVNMVTWKVEHSLVQHCTFPVRDFLGCLPEGRMVVVTDTTRSIPPTKPDRTSLFDSSCKPAATDSSRALFNFSLDSCGTTMTVEGDYLLYENEIRYSQTSLPKEDPLVHIDSPFRLTLRCRYLRNATSTLILQPSANTTIMHRLRPRKRRQGLSWTKRLVRDP